MTATIIVKRWLMITALTVASLIGVHAQDEASKNAQSSSGIVDVIGDGKIDWTKEEIRARGIGIAPKFATTPGQITALAREAAIVAAERNLLKVIAGTHITSETTVQNLILESDVIKTKVSGLLKGAVIVEEKPYGTNGYEVIMAVNLFGKSSLSQAIDLPKQFQTIVPEVKLVPAPIPEVKPDPEVKPVNPPVTVPAAGYTGLIIDCRGMNLSRSMCPRILDQTNANIWGSLSVSTEMVNEKGIAGYYKSEKDQAIEERVGKNPLVIKALRTSGGKTFKTDVVLSPADVELVKAENAKTLFLEKLNVAFLTDK